MKLHELNRRGLWLTVGRWNIAYWTPWVEWVPFAVRNRPHWWGYVRVDRSSR